MPHQYDLNFVVVYPSDFTLSDGKWVAGLLEPIWNEAWLFLSRCIGYELKREPGIYVLGARESLSDILATEGCAFAVAWSTLIKHNMPAYRSLFGYGPAVSNYLYAVVVIGGGGFAGGIPPLAGKRAGLAVVADAFLASVIGSVYPGMGTCTSITGIRGEGASRNGQVGALVHEIGHIYDIGHDIPGFAAWSTYPNMRLTNAKIQEIQVQYSAFLTSTPTEPLPDVVQPEPIILPPPSPPGPAPTPLPPEPRLLGTVNVGTPMVGDTIAASFAISDIENGVPYTAVSADPAMAVDTHGGVSYVNSIFVSARGKPDLIGPYENILSVFYKGRLDYFTVVADVRAYTAFGADTEPLNYGIQVVGLQPTLSFMIWSLYGALFTDLGLTVDVPAWITLTDLQPISDTQARVFATADTTKLSPGSYSDDIVIKDAKGHGGTIWVPVLITVQSAITADFVALPTAGAGPLTVNFYDASLGLPDSWLWDFGDGTTSNIQNPSHTYIVGGTYGITLTVTNSATAKTKTRVDYINVVVADFTVTPEDSPAPLLVLFTNASMGANSWLWDFGDGNTSNQRNPLHTYGSSGTYLVTLTATNSATGASDTVAKNAHLDAEPQPRPPSQWVEVDRVTVSINTRDVPPPSLTGSITDILYYDPIKSTYSITPTLIKVGEVLGVQVRAKNTAGASIRMKLDATFIDPEGGSTMQEGTVFEVTDKNHAYWLHSVVAGRAGEYTVVLVLYVDN